MQKYETLFTRKSLIYLIIPLFIEQFLAIFIGMVDTIMVSGISENAVSAISLVDSINVLFIQLFSALATGGAVVVAQYLGRNKKNEAENASKQLVYVTLYISLIVGLISCIFCPNILSLCFGEIESKTMEYARSYYFISALSYPALAIYNSGAALLRAKRDSKMSMYISVVMNLINVGFNALFIYVCNMEVVGAAIASLIARVTGAVIISFVLCRKTQSLRIHRPFKPQTDLFMMKRILAQGIPNGLENSMFQIGKIMVAGIVAMFSTSIIAANAVGFQLATFANLPGNSINMAIITVVGQCIGAGEKSQAKKYSKQLMITCMILMAVTNITIMFFCDELGMLYNLSHEGMVALNEIMQLFCVSAAIWWATSFALPNILRAAGDAKYTMIVSSFSMWIFRVGFSYIFVYLFNWGLMGVWIAMVLDWVVRSIFFALRFKSGKWLEKSAI